MDDKTFEKLMPRGVKVTLSEGQGAYLFPVGFRHLTRFTKDIQRAIRKLLDIEVPKSLANDPNKVQRVIILEAIPIIMEDLMGLVEVTTVLGELDQNDQFYKNDELSFDDLPHWDVPLLLEAWFDLSFGEERKWLPWVKAAEKAIHRLTGNKISLKEMFSKASSSSATADTISSNEDNEQTMEQISLTEDGP